jgi:hypothetical protein
MVTAGLLVLAAALIVAARSPERDSGEGPVVLRAAVVGLKEEVVPNRSVVAVTAGLRLQFANVSTRPVIILTDRAPLCIGATLTRDAGPARGDNILFEDYRGLSFSEAPEWIALRANLDQASPRIGPLQIVAPGASWDTDSFVVLHPPIKLEHYRMDRPPASWQLLKDSSPVWFRLRCDFWPLNLEPRPTSGRPAFGDKLRKRWQSVGDLQLGSIVSEPTKLDIRDWTRSGPSKQMETR